MDISFYFTEMSCFTSGEFSKRLYGKVTRYFSQILTILVVMNLFNVR